MGGNPLIKCSLCKDYKRLDSFYYVSDVTNRRGFSSWCIDCYQNVGRERRKKNWELAFKHFGGRKCQHCGIESDQPIYDLHHKDPSEKDASIAILFAKKHWKKDILPEVKKCMLLCANCHRIEHERIRLETPELAPKTGRPRTRSLPIEDEIYEEYKGEEKRWNEQLTLL